AFLRGPPPAPAVGRPYYARYRVWSTFNEFPQTAESIVPLLGDELEIPTRVLQSPLIDLPDTLTSMLCAVDQTRLFHNPQVLGNGLASDLRALSELGDGERPAVAQAQD